MANNNFFQMFQPWMDLTSTTVNKMFNLNAKTFENMSKMQMGFMSECATVMGKCTQDMSNPKDFATMPAKVTTELNTLTQQAVEHNKRALDTVIDSANQYRTLSQQVGQEVSDMFTTVCGTEKTASTASKKVA